MADIQNPTGAPFATYLQELLGSGYNVQYVERFNPKTQKPDARYSFYHITHFDQTTGTYLPLNVKINLGFRSEFDTTYGMRDPSGRPAPAQKEFAPEIITKGGTAGYTVPGKWETIYQKDPTAGQDEWGAQDQLFSPTANLADMLRTAFTRTRVALGKGHQNANVYGSLVELITEGSDPTDLYAIPKGAVLNTRSDVNANRMQAARAIQTKNVLDPTINTNEFTQQRRLDEWRMRQIEARQPLQQFTQFYDPDTDKFAWEMRESQVSKKFRDLGLLPDRSSAERLVMMSQGVSNQIGGDPYMVTPKLMKHATIAWKGRQLVTPLDADYMPLQAGKITSRSTPAGYRKTTADIGGRIPEEAFVMGTLITQQTLSPGAGMYFPENMGDQMRHVGYQKDRPVDITPDIKGLISGDIEFKRGSQQVGQAVEGLTRQTAASVKYRGGDEDDFIPIQEDLGSSGYFMSGERLLVPRYYNVKTGMGAQYNKARVDRNIIRELNKAQVRALEKKYGMPVELSDLMETAQYVREGFNLVGAKFADAGEKSEVIATAGRPAVSIKPDKLAARELPISKMTWEVKAFPEMIANSLGGLDTGAQEDLISRYADTLEGDPRQKLVRTALRELQQERVKTPDYRLQLEEFGDKIGLPAHDFAMQMFQNVILGGKNMKQMAEMTNEQLDEFAQSPRNQEMLARFNMGYVSSSMTSPISEMWHPDNYNIQLQAYTSFINAKGREAAEIRGQRRKLSADEVQRRFNQMYGFATEGLEKGDMIPRTYQPSGFYIAPVQRPRAEFPGGGAVGAEDISVMNTVMPTFANRLGVSLKDLTSAGALSRAENLRNPTRWAAQQAAFLSMLNSSTTAEIPDIPDATYVTQDIARRMTLDTEMMEYLEDDKYANLQGMKLFQDKFAEYFPDVKRETLLGRAVHYEAAKGRFQMSPRALSFMTTEDIASRVGEEYSGEDLTRLWNQYRTMTAKSIRGTELYDPDDLSGISQNEVIDAQSKLGRYFMNMFGLPEGGKRNVVKKLLGSDRESVKTRYSFAPGLGQEEIFMSDKLWRQVIRRSAKSNNVDLSTEEIDEIFGMVSGEGKQRGNELVLSKTPEYVAEYGAPGYQQRYPLGGTKSFGWAARYLTQAHLRRQGREEIYDQGGAMGQYWARMGMFLPTAEEGDQDLDPGMFDPGLVIKRLRGGKLAVRFGGLRPGGGPDPVVEESIERTRTTDYQKLRAERFPSLEQQRMYDPLLGAFADKGFEGLAGLTRNLMQKQMGAARTYGYEKLYNTAANYLGAKLQMGVTYDFTRMMTASAEAGGWSREGIERLGERRSELYQPFLDLMSGTPHALVNMFSTAKLTESKRGGFGMTWGKARGDIFDPMRFIRPASLEPTQAITTLERMATQALATKGGKELLSPETFAAYFSPEEERAFTPERGLVEQQQLNVQRQRLMEDTEARLQTEQQERDYYSQISLQEALTPAYEATTPTGEPVDARRRSRGMREAYARWMRANYGDRPELAQQANIYRGMFSKAIAKQERDMPGWEPPKDWLGYMPSQELVKEARKSGPLWGLLRGRLMPGDQMMRFYNRIGDGPLGQAMTWAKGALGSMGFETLRTESANTTLYEEAMAKPVQIRGHLLGAMAGKGPYYGTKTTVGGRKGTYFSARDDENLDVRQHQELAMRKQTAYTIANLLGVDKGIANEFVGALFPKHYNKAIEEGQRIEAQLGALMTNEWFGAANVNRDEAGYLVPRPKDEMTTEYTGAVKWAGDIRGYEMEGAATPDFVRLVEDEEGETFLQFIEQKSPGRDISNKQLVQRFAGEKMQSMYPAWLMLQNVKDYESGIPELKTSATRNIEGFIETFFPSQGGNWREDPNSLRYKAWDAILNRRLGSTMLITQREGRAEQMIKEGDKQGLRDWIANFKIGKHGNPRWRYSGEQDRELQTLEKDIGDITEEQMRQRPRMLEQIWRGVENAPTYYQNALAGARKLGQPVGKIIESLDIMNRVRNRMKVIGGAAIDQRTGGTGGIPDLSEAIQPGITGTLFSDIRREAGPAFAQWMQQDPNLTRERYQASYQGVQQAIEHAVATGQPISVEATGYNSPDLMQSAYMETAQSMGYFAMGQQWVDEGKVGFSMGVGVVPDVQDDPTYRKMQGVLKRYGTLRDKAVGAGDQERANRMAQKWQMQQDKMRQYKADFTRDFQESFIPPLPGGREAREAAGLPPTQPPDDGGRGPNRPGGGGNPPDDGDDPDEPKKYSPEFTASAATLWQDYSKWRQPIEEARVAMRQFFGAGDISEAIAARGMSKQAIYEQFRQHAPAALMAKELASRARTLTPKLQQVDPNRVPADAFTRIADLQDTTTAVGSDITDVMSVVENFSKEGRKEASAILRGQKALKVEPTQDVKDLYFQQLSEASKKVTEAFTNMAQKQGDYTKNLEISTNELAKIERYKKQMAVEEAAAPLLESGVLARQPGATGLGQGIVAGPNMPAGRATGAIAEQLSALDQAQQGLAGFEASLMPGKDDKGLGGFFRKTLSGFGMMYLRSIFGLATQGLSMGAQERAGLDSVFGMTGAGLAGSSVLPYNQQQQMATRRGLYGANQQVLPGIANWIQTTPGVSDVANMGTAGMGTFAMLSWMAGNIPADQTGLITRKGLTNATPALALGTAVASGLLTGYQKAQDPEGLAYRYATGGWLQNLNVTDSLATWYMSNAAQKQQTQAIATQYRTIAANMDTTPEQLAKFFSGDAEQNAATYSYIQKLLQGENLDIAPEALAGGFRFGQMAGFNVQDIPEIARRMQTTGFDASMLEGLFTSRGLSGREMYEGGYMRKAYEWISRQNYGMLDMQQFAVGTQAFQQLGTAGGLATQDLTPVQMVNYAMDLSQLAPQRGFAPFVGAVNIWEQWQKLGQREGEQAPFISSYMDMSPYQQGVEELRQRGEESRIARTQSIQDVFQNYLGYSAPAATDVVNRFTEGMSLGALDEFGERASQWSSIMEYAYQRNPSLRDDEQWRVDMMGRYFGKEQLYRKPYTLDMIAQAQQGDPFAMAQAYQYEIDVPGKNINAITGGQRGTWQTGPMAGMVGNFAPFTVSGQGEAWFPALQSMLTPEILGTDVGQAFQFGYQMEGTNLPAIGGTMGMQLYMQDQRYALQEKQQALSGGYAAIQREYLPQIWAVQDRMTNLGYEQQQWQFGRSLEGLRMGAQQQQEQWGLSLRQNEMQRGWAREDWVFSDQQRSQQWGWKVEDFQENLRFMTGRQRRLAERQMERDTLVKGQEDERVTEQRKRQEEMWALEDERFDMQRQHAEENRKFQEEGIKKQREYYEENFKLQRQLVELQREMQLKQLALNEAQVALQKEMMEQARAQEQIMTAIQVVSLLNQTYVDNEKVAREGIKGLSEETNTLQQQAFEAINDWLQQFIDDFGFGDGGTGSPTGDGGLPQNDPRTQVPTGSTGGYVPKPSELLPRATAWGDSAWAGAATWVGETGPEVVNLSGSSLMSRKRGEIIPSASYDPWKSEQIGSVGVASQPKSTVIVVNVGNEELKRYVVDAVQQEI